MREKSSGCWALGGGLANQAPDLATFQVLHNKTDSINMKLEPQFGHRLMVISVFNHPGIINRKSPITTTNTTANLEISPKEWHASWDPFPIESSDMLWYRTSQRCLSLDVGQNPIWWFSALSISLSESKQDNSLRNICAIYLCLRVIHFVNKSFEPEMKVKSFGKTPL